MIGLIIEGSLEMIYFQSKYSRNSLCNRLFSAISLANLSWGFGGGWISSRGTCNHSTSFSPAACNESACNLSRDSLKFSPMLFLSVPSKESDSKLAMCSMIAWNLEIANPLVALRSLTLGKFFSAKFLCQFRRFSVRNWSSVP